jgi:hypothetical protein
MTVIPAVTNAQKAFLFIIACIPST